jgi:hypothetical protein
MKENETGGNIARINAYRILTENVEESDHSEDQGVDRRIILKFILRI